ncbi:Hypothetical predicted protein, partial [Paramuricea clavata]
IFLLDIGYKNGTIDCNGLDIGWTDGIKPNGDRGVVKRQAKDIARVVITGLGFWSLCLPRSDRSAYQGVIWWFGSTPDDGAALFREDTAPSNPGKGLEKKKQLKIAVWNVRTLQSERTTERRTAIIGLELERYNIDIAALSETRFAGTRQLTEPTSGYTYLWSGLPESEKRLYGVGFAIKTSIVKELENLPTAVNERLMWLRVKINEKRYATIISAYAPTMTNEEVVKEKFYADLDNILRKTPKEDKLILLGDFNARVGANSTSWSRTIVRQRDLKDVCITQAMCGAECQTDHRMIRMKLKMIIQPQRRKVAFKGVRKLNVDRLKSNEIKNDSSVKMETALNQLADRPSDSEFADKHDAKKFYDAVKGVYGPSTRGTSPLLSADGTKLISDRNEILNRWVEHFNELLNRASTVQQNSIDNIKQQPVQEHLADRPSKAGIRKAIKTTSKWKGTRRRRDTRRNLQTWWRGNYQPSLLLIRLYLER